MYFKIISIIVAIFIMPRSSYSQNFEFQVLDSLSKEPISFPVITTKEGKQFYADLDGKFIIYDSQSSEIIISCIGYNDKIILPPFKSNEVLLSSKNILLKSVIISANQKLEKPTQIGYSKMKKKLIGTFKPFVGSIIAAYIPPTLNKSKIDGIIIPLRNTKKNSYIRIYLFDVGPDGNPGNSLLDENLIFESTKVPKIIYIKEYNIILPESGIFVGVEWLSKEKPNEFISAEAPRIRLNYELTENFTFECHPFKNIGWKKVDLITNDKNYRNAAFGLIVRPY